MRTMLFFVVAGICVSANTQEPNQPAFFMPGSVSGEYTVNTGFVKGALGGEGRAWGLLPLVTEKDNMDLSGSVGLLTYYRVFTTNHRHCESMRALPCETSMEAKNRVRFHWSTGEERPFTLTAIYQWVAPDTIDLETVVEAKATLPDFDVFLSSYMTPEFPVSSVYAKVPDTGNAFVTAEPEEGVWQVFPRDDAAIKLIQDGRWKIEPSPVDWAIRPYTAAPLIYRRHEQSGLTVATMARPEDCFAVFTPQRGETHYSMYFSLFGRTLKEGETVRARVRMVIGDMDDAALLKRYDAFVSEK
jgi:hypothetical protein